MVDKETHPEKSRDERDEEVTTKASRDPITQAKKAIVDFCVKEFKREAAAIRFLKLVRGDAGWRACVEITEENLYLKQMGYPPVYDRHVYTVDLDASGGVSGFSEKGLSEDDEL